MLYLNMSYFCMSPQNKQYASHCFMKIFGFCLRNHSHPYRFSVELSVWGLSWPLQNVSPFRLEPTCCLLICVGLSSYLKFQGHVFSALYPIALSILNLTSQYTSKAVALFLYNFVILICNISY